MAMKTVSGLMQDIAHHVNGVTTAPTAGTDEYNQFLNALNQSQDDVAAVDYDWEGLRYVHRTTLGVSGTSVSLPTNFVKPMGFLKVEDKEYPQIGAEETGKFLSDDDYVVYNYAEKYCTINPAAASVSRVDIPYLAHPSTLATLTQTSFVPSDQFLTKRSAYYILLTRENPRYEEYKRESDLLLAQMIGKEVHDFVQRDSSIKNDLRDVQKFELGVD
jgi:hypothetical protein